MSRLAPIVLFTYNRPWHTKETLEALASNPLSAQSDLIIYSDASKNPSKQDLGVLAVRDLLSRLYMQNKKFMRFKNIEIVERTANLGLADSIIDGVGRAMREYGRAIVLEDDIVVSPVFLRYMNEALDFYENEEKVWSIGAWSAPIDTTGLGSCYFFRIPYCWGWASWQSRWQHYRRDIDWALESFSAEDIYQINLEDSMDYWEHLLLNHSGRIKTWAIFHYLIAYKRQALTLLPSRSFIRQIGFDGSGVHCGSDGQVYNPRELNTNLPISYPDEILESKLALRRIQLFEIERRKKNLAKRLAKLKRNIGNGIAKRLAKLVGGACQRLAASQSDPHFLHNTNSSSLFVYTCLSPRRCLCDLSPHGLLASQAQATLLPARPIEVAA